MYATLLQIFLFQLPQLIRIFVSDSANQYQDVATSWLLAVAIITLGWAFFAFALKWFIKSLAKLPYKKLWGRSRTIVYILAGAVFLSLIVWLVWKSSVDYIFVVGVPGLFRGIFIAGSLYIILMLLLHLFGDARRDLYYRKS